MYKTTPSPTNWKKHALRLATGGLAVLLTTISCSGGETTDEEDMVGIGGDPGVSAGGSFVVGGQGSGGTGSGGASSGGASSGGAAVGGADGSGGLDAAGGMGTGGAAAGGADGAGGTAAGGADGAGGDNSGGSGSGGDGAGGSGAGAHPDDAVEFEGHWYRLTEAAISAPDAQAICSGLGGYLACIESQPEDAFLFTVAGTSRPWIGLNDELTVNDYVWVNGSPVTYENWQPGQPDYPESERWVKITEDGTWDDGYIESSFICEWED